jgi:hypothetical protein
MVPFTDAVDSWAMPAPAKSPQNITTEDRALAHRRPGFPQILQTAGISLNMEDLLLF